MPLYEYQCDACAHRFEVIQKYSDAPIEVCPKCGGAGEEAVVVAGDSVQGHRACTSPTTPASSDSSDEHRTHAREQVRASAPRVKSESKSETKSEAKSETKTETKSETKTEIEDRDQVGQLKPTSAYFTVLRYSRNGAGQLGTLQREVDARLQEPQLVAGVVADAVDLHTRRSAATSADDASRWSAESRLTCPSLVAWSEAKMSGVRM